MSFNGKITGRPVRRSLYVFLLLLLSCHDITKHSSKKTVHEDELQTSRVQLFAPGIISTSRHELNVTFSPDGSMLFYTIANNSAGNTFYTIFSSRKRNGRWSQPVIAPFSGQYSDADPFFSPDGKQLYFISLRPSAGTGSPKSDFDIWCTRYENNRWLDPQHLGDSVNTDKDELYPAVSRKGNLYFSRESEGNYDIMVAHATDIGYKKAFAAKGALNTKAIEYDAYVSPDEVYMIFTAIGRDDGLGSGDLYISHNQNGEWSEGLNLGAEINSSFMDQCPTISPDGRRLFFTSFRDNDAFKFQQKIDTQQYFRLLASPFNGSANILMVDAGDVLRSSAGIP